MSLLSSCEIGLLRSFIEWVQEDSPFGDLTSELVVPELLDAKAVVLSKTPGIATCTRIIANVLRNLGIETEVFVKDRSSFKEGTEILKLMGNARKILLFERTLLDLLMYLYGVATATKKFVERVREVNPKVKVAATRKYPPGLGCLIKRAVRDGGGDTHRFSLSDAILIKDNHIKIAGSVKEAIRRALRGRSFIHKIEVEVNTVEQAVEAAEMGVDVIMFDNMRPNDIEEAIELLKKKGLRKGVILEASGGISLDNIKDYATLDLDVISTSMITMRPERVDLSLEVI